MIKIGAFTVPIGLRLGTPEQTNRDLIEWDLQVARWADAAGLSEIFFAEHFTIGHEPSPAPELMIAAASRETSSITLGSLGHLLPYHNPIALAHRILWLDHMTGGRYICGVAPGAFPTDNQLFSTGKSNPAMFDEALEIILAICRRTDPFTMKGEFWTVDMPAYSEAWHGPHLRPYRAAGIPFAVTGASARSASFTTAAKNGVLPVSSQIAVPILREQWAHYENASHTYGRNPSRADWRISRDIVVADTDREARELAVRGGLGRTWREIQLPTFRAMNMLSSFTGGAIPDSDVTDEWIIDNLMIVGSPDTVVAKIERLYEDVGGFGGLVSIVYDETLQPERCEHSIKLLGTEVAPRLGALG